MTSVIYQPPGSATKRCYVCVSCDRADIEQLNKEPDKYLPEWIEHSKHNNSDMIYTRKVAFEFTHLSRHNFLALNSLIYRQIQNICIVTHAFKNENLPVPEFVPAATVHNLWELDHMRSNPASPSYMRDKYDATYRAAVNGYAQRYNETYRDKLIKSPGKKKSHKVKEDYFKVNHIACDWDVVSKPFMEYIEEQLKKGRFPDFIYYKPDKAFLKTKNLAKMFQDLGSSGPNFWKAHTGMERYYFAYPSNQASMFYTMLNEFNVRNYESCVSMEHIRKAESELEPTQLIRLHMYDLKNWNSLCQANGVQWAIDDGTFSQRELTVRDTLEEIPVLYRYEDMDMVSKITARLAREMRDYVPISDTMIDESRTRSMAEYVARLDQKENKQVTEIDRNSSGTR